MEFKTFRIHDLFIDEDFGEIVLEEDLIQPENSSYTCQFKFLPTNEAIKAVLKERPGGPFEWQRQFLRQLYMEYGTIKEALYQRLVDDFTKIGIPLKMERFDQEFKPVFLSLESRNEIEQEWELNFTTLHDTEYLIIVSFKDWQLITIDFIN